LIRFSYGVGVVLVLVEVGTGAMGTPRLQAQVPSVRSTQDVISRLENEVPGLMKQGGVPGKSIAFSAKIRASCSGIETITASSELL
jgi:hypothetical protein